MRKITVNSLQFSFTDKVNWNIKPMIKMKKVSFRGGKKIVSEFYGELVIFENMGLWLMLPAQEVVSFVYSSSNDSCEKYNQLVMNCEGGLDWVEHNVYDGKKMRLLEGSKGMLVKEADFFMGKCRVELYNPLKLQGCTAVLVKFREQ